MRKATIAGLMIMGGVSPAFGWGTTGHRVTGEIAEKFLSPQARGAISELLGSETLAEAANWPDEMRSNPDQFWQKTAAPYHYVTVPKGKVYADVGAPSEGDAVTALLKFADTLKNPDSTVEERQLALRFTIHIVGDLHQPLHAGNGEDLGGNTINVEFFGEKTKLHAVWDSGMIDRAQLSYTEWASLLTAKITPQELQQWADPDPLVWIAESTAIRDVIYPDSDKLSYDYVYEHHATVEARLGQGGIRIATYLNALFE